MVNPKQKAMVKKLKRRNKEERDRLMELVFNSLKVIVVSY